MGSTPRDLLTAGLAIGGAALLALAALDLAGYHTFMVSLIWR